MNIEGGPLRPGAALDVFSVFRRRRGKLYS
jgi:hypothetical protein